MTEEIDGYAEDLERLVSTLRDGLDRLSRAKEDRKGNIIAGLESTLTSAKATYGSFNTAFREIDKAIQPKYQPIGVQFRDELTKITATLKDARNAQDRKDAGMADDQRTTTEILDEAARVQKESKQSTERSKNVIKEMTETGNATLEQLQQDRSKLENVADDLVEIDSDLKLAQNQLKSIARKLTKDRLIRGLCIIACLIILTALIVVIVKRNKAKGGKDTT
jgi:chromosome segregation ATPase